MSSVEERWQADRMVLVEKSDEGENIAAISAEYPMTVRE